MKMNNFILEEQNLENEQEAYGLYSQVEKLFYDRREVYRKSFENIISKQIEDIQPDEMHSIDKMAKQVFITQKNYQDIKDTLNQKIDSLIMNIRQLELDYKTYIKQESDIPLIHNAKKNYEEALILKDHDLTRSLEKAYNANKQFQTLTSDIKKKWINRHKSRLALIEDLEVI